MVKGKVRKVKGIKFITTFRHLYLNPIEGVVITYRHSNQFPHKPHSIMKLLDIKSCEVLSDNKWYFGQNFYYFQLRTNSGPKKTYFTENKQCCEFWVDEINKAKEFYLWYQALVDMRYRGATAKTQEDEELRKAADELINFFKNLDLPEVDLGKFKGSNIREFAASICSSKKYNLQSS